jgi:hypothetical protein
MFLKKQKMENIKFRAFWKGVNQFRFFEQPTLTCSSSDKGTYGMFFPSNDGAVFMGRTTPQLFTGFQDDNKTDIYDGDILSDFTETDEGIVSSRCQVYFCKETGAWMLDNSYLQDKKSGELLSKELKDFKYIVVGHINEN